MMTITIMPMLLGLAVDDTIHFINYAKLAFEHDRDYAHAIRHTFSAIGIPLLFTSVILTANFSVYLSSPAKVLIFMGVFTGTGIKSFWYIAGVLPRLPEFLFNLMANLNIR